MRFSDRHKNRKKNQEGRRANQIITEAIEDGRMEDKVVTKIKNLSDINRGFSYYEVSKFAKEEITVDVWNELDRGRAIPKTLNQLNYYWKYHAPMIKSQWEIVFRNCSVGSYEGGVEIIDYGCRDGLASLLFLDNFYWDFKKGISKIKLIEPSSLALQRARTVLECYCPNTQTNDINKNIDDLETKDLETDKNLWKIHLFSNILDIDGFDITNLFNKIIKNKGNHTFLAVSHDRNFLGGTPRLESIYRGFTKSKYDHLKINWHKKEKFHCKNGKAAIYFIIDLKVA